MNSLFARQPSFEGSVRYEGYEEYEEIVTDANKVARNSARLRLRGIYPQSTLIDLDRSFATAHAHKCTNRPRPEYPIDRLVQEICCRPRPIAIGKATGLEVVFKGPDDRAGMPPVGTAIELDSNVTDLEPERLKAFAESGGSVELRQFDRHCLDWAPIADDIATLSGADVYMKLFVAGGARTANGWHNDATDVIATVISGSKRWEISDDARTADPALDVLLRVGDAVWVPRGRDHQVSTTGELSALISVGLMRVGDWAYRREAPIHLGLCTYPRSALAYRLSLRPHAHTALVSADIPPTGIVHASMIGGLFVNGATPDAVHVSTNGRSYALDPRVLALVLNIQSMGPIDVELLAQQSILRAAEFDDTMMFLTAERLVVIR